MTDAGRAACLLSGYISPASQNSALRKRLANDDAYGMTVDAVTRERALAELSRYRTMFPSAAPEITAVALFGRMDSWEEFTAIRAALREALKDGEG